MPDSSDNALIQDIHSGDNIFSLPAALHEVLEVLGDENASIDRLARAIQSDPGLAATALRVANSPYYRRVSEVTSLSDAVQTLGDTTVKTIALTATILNPRHIAGSSGIRPEALVANSLNVATIAHEIAILASSVPPEEALMGGLLTELGMLYFISRHGNRYRKVVANCAKGANLLEEERREFGMDHTVVGAELAKSWLLPKSLIACICRHHAGTGKDCADSNLSRVVRLATLITADAHIDYARDPQRDLLEELRLQKALGIDDHAMRDLIDRSQRELGELAGRFGADVGACEDLVTRANRKLGYLALSLERTLAERDDMYQRQLKVEKELSAIESRTQTVTELAHHVNNAATVIAARAELLENTLAQSTEGEVDTEIAGQLAEIRLAVDRINSALKEMSEVQGLEELARQTVEFSPPRIG